MKKIGKFQYIRVAEDPEELSGPTKEEMVDEWEKSPEANVDEYFQLIVRKLQNQYGKPVKLINPHLSTELGSPSAGFDIVGHLKWPEGRPLAIQEQFGNHPVLFKAYVADGNLIDEIFLDFG